jgi:hypothetical protein
LRDQEEARRLALEVAPQEKAELARDRDHVLFASLAARPGATPPALRENLDVSDTDSAEPRHAHAQTHAGHRFFVVTTNQPFSCTQVFASLRVTFTGKRHWDRTQRGIFPKGAFELIAGPLLSGVLRTVRGGAWWRSAKHTGFIPRFVADVDAVLAKDSGGSVVVDEVVKVDATDSR